MEGAEDVGGGWRGWRSGPWVAACRWGSGIRRQSCGAAALRAVFDLVPITCPFFAPCERKTAARTQLGGQVGLLVHGVGVPAVQRVSVARARRASARPLTQPPPTPPPHIQSPPRPSPP